MGGQTGVDQDRYRSGVTPGNMDVAPAEDRWMSSFCTMPSSVDRLPILCNSESCFEFDRWNSEVPKSGGHRDNRQMNGGRGQS
jgi:hypothetical protein